VRRCAPPSIPARSAASLRLSRLTKGYIGGKATNRKSRKVREKQAYSRLGSAWRGRAHIPNQESQLANAELASAPSGVEKIISDDGRLEHLSQDRKKFTRHFAVTHSIEEYVRGDAHVNTAENYFSILKRGDQRRVSPRPRTNICRCTLPSRFPLQRPLGAWCQRSRARRQVAQGIVGKRLTYRRPDEATRP